MKEEQSGKYVLWDCLYQRRRSGIMHLLLQLALAGLVFGLAAVLGYFAGFYLVLFSIG